MVEVGGVLVSCFQNHLAQQLEQAGKSKLGISRQGHIRIAAGIVRSNEVFP